MRHDGEFWHSISSILSGTVFIRTVCSCSQTEHLWVFRMATPIPSNLEVGGAKKSLEEELQATHLQSSDEPGDGWETGAEIWSELPSHIMENILGRLPVISFLRFRAVCKEWNNLASCPSFLRSCYSTPGKAPLFLLYADRARERYPVYDPGLNSWCLLPRSSFFLEQSSRSLVIVAASGGLLCLADLYDADECNSSFYVVNPITNGRRRLPAPKYPMEKRNHTYVVGMVTDSEKNCYKILLAQHGEHLKLQLYDSTKNSWQILESVKKRVALLVGSASTDGILYCLSYGATFAVIACDLEKGTWQDLEAPLPGAVTWPDLFVSRGKLSLVGAITNCGLVKSICVWQLNASRKAWEHVLSVPGNLLEELSRRPRGPYFLFIADGDYICFARHQVSRMLMCNIANNTWWWLPLVPSEEYIGELSFAGFSLQPRLDITV